MLIYDLEKRGRHPLYEYLYLCIREDILRGVIKAGEKLPSKREMAQGLGIALITVENAYAQLMIEGYISARERSGYYVEHVLTEGAYGQAHGHAAAQEDGEESAPRMTAQSTSYKGAGSGRLSASRIAALGGGGGDKSHMASQKGEGGAGDWLVDFSSGAIRKDAFPMDSWAKLMRRVLSDGGESLLEKPASKGVFELRRVLADYLQKAKGLEVDPEQILIGPGTEYLHHVILQLLGPGRIVAVEDPGYKKVGQIYEGDGLKCLHVPVDQNGLIVSKLWGSNASLVHTSPSHHFPTGCVMSIGRRRELLHWANEQGAYIIEDDYDSEFRFDGRPISTLASLDGDRVIYMNTFTKTLAPSIRIAYAVLPRKLVDGYDRKLFYYSGAVSSFEQYTLAAFIGEGYYERHINRMRNYYRQQRKKILEALRESPLSERAAVEEHTAGLHFILKISGIKEDERWLGKLREKGIRLSPVSEFCYGQAEKYRHRFVVYYSDLEEENLRKAFEIMAELQYLEGM